MMKRLLLIMMWLWGGGIWLSSLYAQRSPGLFQAYTWEQACLQAARENKLVLVAVGNIDSKIEKKISGNSDLMIFLQRNVVAIRWDEVQTQKLQARLLLYEPPMFAFLMPYGDLLEMASPEEVAKDPFILRERFEKAKQLATVKKNNSRSVRFDALPFEEALKKSDESDRLICLYFTADQQQACLLLEKNVLNLDEVADCYNQHFINLRINTSKTATLAQQYDIHEVPALLFLNRSGKEVYRTPVVMTQEQLLESAEIALKKAQGISFQELTDEEARQKARQENKLVFVDMYIPGGAHKEMLRTVFADPEVASLFERHFVNVSRESGRAFLIFQDADGKELHRVKSNMGPEELLQEAQLVLTGQGLAGMEAAYQAGNRDADFLESYMKRLERADMWERAAQIAAVYFGKLNFDSLREEKYWNLFNRYYQTADSELFQDVLMHRRQLYDRYGEDTVRKKIADIWIAGAENFVKDGKFDEAGFKVYTKRLKKEKVEGWRQIVRNARMHAAEKVGDWRTFVVLAEEKWYEEKIPDAELYSWGVKINENCDDEGIRYKAAHWFVQAVREMERKEQISGKVSMTSYKGFFEKLVDDLLGKK